MNAIITLPGGDSVQADTITCIEMIVFKEDYRVRVKLADDTYMFTGVGTIRTAKRHRREIIALWKAATNRSTAHTIITLPNGDKILANTITAVTAQHSRELHEGCVSNEGVGIERGDYQRTFIDMDNSDETLELRDEIVAQWRAAVNV